MKEKVSSFFSAKELAVLLCAAFILILPALYNGYPVVTPDSAAYVDNAFGLSVPLDRPLGYSLFIRLASLGFTLWGVVLCQALMLAFFIRIICRHYLAQYYRNGLFFAVVTALALFTSCAWFCGQLMPDIFAANMLLALIVWYVVPFNARWQKWLLALFILVVLMLHNSHALILILFAGGISIIAWLRKRAWLRPSLTLLALSITALLGFSAMNTLSGKGFRPSAASGVFLMCRLVENGVMDKFLAENCDHNQYNLCPYRDSLPIRQWEFMWMPESPMTKTGGWQANEENYKAIEWKIFTTPRYLVLFLFKSGEGTVRQLAQVYAGDGTGTFNEGSGPYNVIRDRFPYEFREYRAAMQQAGALPFFAFNVIIILSAILLLIASLLTGATSAGLSRQWQVAFSLVILYLFCNAAVTATFSTVLGRFNARVFWVLPFFCLLFLLQAFLRKKDAVASAEKYFPDTAH